MGKFNKGLFLGGILGAGLMWLNVTKKGKKLRDELLDHAAVIYEEVKEKAMSSEMWKEMNKNKYVELVKETVNKYAVKNALSENFKNMIEKVVCSQWCNLEKKIKK
jgi:gas vesicle protein